MFRFTSLIIGVVLGLPNCDARAERRPEQRDEAELVVVGTVKKIATRTSKYGGDGIQTHYTADVAVGKVERGKGARAEETIKVNWSNVTKQPSRPVAGAYGHRYSIKAKDRARFWLMKGDKGWSVIYNSNGVEKLKK